MANFSIKLATRYRSPRIIREIAKDRMQSETVENFWNKSTTNFLLWKPKCILFDRISRSSGELYLRRTTFDSSQMNFSCGRIPVCSWCEFLASPKNTEARLEFEGKLATFATFKEFELIRMQTRFANELSNQSKRGIRFARDRCVVSFRSRLRSLEILCRYLQTIVFVYRLEISIFRLVLDSNSGNARINRREKQNVSKWIDSTNRRINRTAMNNEARRKMHRDSM